MVAAAYQQRRQSAGKVPPPMATRSVIATTLSGSMGIERRVSAKISYQIGSPNGTRMLA